MEFHYYLILPILYIFLSAIFYFFPQLIHKRKQYTYRPFNEIIEFKKFFCIGHRGGSYQGAQNTMQVFKKTKKLCHMFQLDICITKDGKLVVHHDPNLHRTCGLDKNIDELNYDQLPCFSEYYQPYGSAGQMKTQNNRIPLLQDIFKEFPEKPMNIDLKTPNDEAIKQFDRLITKYKRQNITVWGTFDDQKNQKIFKTNSKILSFYSPKEMRKITFMCLAGLLPFCKIRQAFIQIPLLTEEMKVSIRQNSTSQFSAFSTIATYSFLNLVSRIFIPHLRKRGIPTFFWIVNGEHNFQTAVSMGCTGIISDQPTALSQFLKNKKIITEETTKSD